VHACPYYALYVMLLLLYYPHLPFFVCLALVLFAAVSSLHPPLRSSSCFRCSGPDAGMLVRPGSAFSDPAIDTPIGKSIFLCVIQRYIHLNTVLVTLQQNNTDLCSCPIHISKLIPKFPLKQTLASTRPQYSDTFSGHGEAWPTLYILSRSIRV
jgi:hypothetical protein